MGNEQGKLAGVATPAGIQSMDESLQKKFAKGIQYNSRCQGSSDWLSLTIVPVQPRGWLSMSRFGHR